ncbi:MAG: NAD-binding protein, partial [Pseudomonadota bacterium]
LEALRKFGFKIFYGDVTRPDLLHAAGIEKASLLIVAIDGKEPINELVHYVRKNYPHVPIIARAVDRHHVYDLYAAGCRDIIRETFDSSVRTGRTAYEAMGMHPFDAELLARKFSEDDRYILREMAEVHDPEIPGHQNPAYVEKSRTLMAERDAQIFGKGQAFAARNDQGWLPPTSKDVTSLKADHKKSSEN